jgi:hypothetical protein
MLSFSMRAMRCLIVILKFTGPGQTAAATLAGVEVAHMIRKEQIPLTAYLPSSTLQNWRHSHVRKVALSRLTKNLRQNLAQSSGRVCPESILGAVAIVNLLAALSIN